MGLRLYNITIPASGAGVDPVPISVSGCTTFFCQGDIQVAVDPTNFNTGQFAIFIMGFTGQTHEAVYPDNTILWVRLDPTAGTPATLLNVQTGLNKGVY